MKLLNLIGNNILITKERELSINSAIDLMCSQLLQQHKITPNYVEEIKKKHKEIGAYYVLAPKIAMPHARPEDGVNEASIQLTVFKNGVDLGSTDNGDVYISATLAAQDSDNHIHIIMALAELFQNDDDIDAIIHAENIAEIQQILAKY